MTQNTITLIVLAVLVVFSLPALYRKKKSGDLTLWGKGRNILGSCPRKKLLVQRCLPLPATDPRRTFCSSFPL